MSTAYTEPHLSVLVLDYCKPIESRICLESVKRHIRFPHTVIFCDNGSGEDYAMQFVREGLVDQLVVNRDSRGLGLGTRDLFAAAQGAYSFYLQNDQLLFRDFTEDEFRYVTHLFGAVDDQTGKTVCSVSLAGSPCGEGVYSERAHIIATTQYRQWEQLGLLGYYGAGRYHDGPWREAQIQAIYEKHNRTHYAHQSLVRDHGVYAIRDMGSAGVWCHRTDTKALWCIVPPTETNPVYPKLSEKERAYVAEFQTWPDGQVPEGEVKDSFHCWDGTNLAQMQSDYIKDLRRRFSQKWKTS